MATGQFIASPGPQCSHYEQPGIIVPPPSTSNLSVPRSNPVLSTSPCPECALHSTILHSMAFNMQSMDAACHHLHASASCSSCYSNFQLQQNRFAMGNGHHNQHAHARPGEYQCGHSRQVKPSYQRTDPSTSSNGIPSYQGYQYQDWHPVNLPRHEPYQAQVMQTPNGESCSYQHTTSATMVSLPSPTFSVPSISPYLDSQTRFFDMTPATNTKVRESKCENSFSELSASRAGPLQPGNTYMGQVTDLDSVGIECRTSYGDQYTRVTDNKLESEIKIISSIKLSDESTDMKTEPVERSNSTVKNVAEKRKLKTQSKVASNDVRKRQPEDLCQVCGDRASGYHYNALTCEGCKGFFRRSITNKTTYKQGCKQGGTCEMDTYTRRKCPQCRLKKCREVGMLEECLLTEIQCQSKRRRRKNKHQEHTEEVKHEELSQSYSEASPSQSSVTSSPCGSDISRNDETPVSLALTEDENAIIGQVLEAFKQYKINPEIVKRWEKYINKESNKTCRLSDITTVHVQVLVEYTKSLPGFITLDPEDQIALLKGSVMEAMLLRNSCGYHHLTREINMPAIIDETGIEASQIAALMEFFCGIGKLEMDEIEYALLIAVVVFNSDYPYVKNKTVVEEYQDQYLSTLAKYSMSREPRRPFIFPRILASLTEIRSLSHYHAELVTSWKKRGDLTPLLCEIWDLD